jgi:SET domain-containing protein
LAISNSSTQGWGLFTLEDIKKNELIAEYIGEMLEEKEVRQREIWNDIEEVTYMFKLTETVKIIFNILYHIVHRRFQVHWEQNSFCEPF